MSPAHAVVPLLDAERMRVDAWLERLAERAAEAHAAPLGSALRYAITGGGKRLRAVLCVLTYRALGGTGEAGIDDVACALELVHAYSLVHDDLPCMDDDDLRRGRPTLHRVAGTPAAMVTGTALIPLAFEALARGTRALRLDPTAAAALAGELAAAAGGGGMVGGQWLDLEAERRTVPLAELAAIHEAKTGALFRASLALGARAARASEPRVAACAGFGAALGLAFQVVDDILDETADATTLGKTAGKDRRQQKATYPTLLGVEGARERARRALAEGLERLRGAGIASENLEAVGEWVLARDH